MLKNTLRTRRQELGLMQSQLADLVGVTQQTISRWESGEVTPPPKRLGRIAEVLDMDMDRLLSYAGYLPSNGSLDDAQVIRLVDEQIDRLTDADLLTLAGRIVEELAQRKTDSTATAGNGPGVGAGAPSEFVPSVVRNENSAD